MDLVEKLKEIGFNSYEAKVYIALLKKYPATGYEVSKLAGIPQSRTYDTLKVLEEKNIVTSANTKPVTYTPIKPKLLTSRFQKKINSTINFLDKHLPEVKDNYNVIVKKEGGSYTETVTFPYDPKMKLSTLELRVDAKCSKGKKANEFVTVAAIPVAQGVSTIQLMADYTAYMTIMPDNFKRVTTISL